MKHDRLRLARLTALAFCASGASFFRLFMVPGMSVPSRLPASQSIGGKTVRTRPLCPYPQVAKCQGAGCELICRFDLTGLPLSR